MAFMVAFELTHVHPAAGPEAAEVGATATVCKYRARAPVTNGAAIDVPTKFA